MAKGCFQVAIVWSQPVVRRRLPFRTPPYCNRKPEQSIDLSGYIMDNASPPSLSVSFSLILPLLSVELPQGVK